ncbi:MAG: DUF1524 domain-containing protein [Propionibacteriales bacterium]|nr:DUF1524 domain-containing protein [Propionibacteriales bacterium]
MLTRAVVVLMCVPLAVVVTPAAPAVANGNGNGNGNVVSVRLRQAVSNLPVATETRAGYDRDKFRHWIDADDDCRDTRDEVLASESLIAVHGCDIRAGRWHSYYDGVVTRDSSDFDIDHLVPLAEAWDSGAKKWTAGTRQRFANDLGDRRSLVAVTASSNRSKGDQDPADWIPRLGRCHYVTQWVAVKIRWRLKVNAVEKRSLTQRARGCTNVVINVRRASVRTGTSSGGGSDPRFSTCGEAIAHGFGPYVRGRDEEYGWYTDADSDGIVCES